MPRKPEDTAALVLGLERARDEQAEEIEDDLGEEPPGLEAASDEVFDALDAGDRVRFKAALLDFVEIAKG